MPAEDIEIDEATEEGVQFKYLANPIEIIGNGGRVSQIRLQKMELGEPDAGGRRSPVPIEGEEETIDVDSVIVAIGQLAQTAGFEELSLTRRGTVAADENTFRTNLEGVFAVGDATNKGADIAVSAVGEARRAAHSIDGYLNGQTAAYREPYSVKSEKTEEDFSGRQKIPRVRARHLKPDERKTSFNEANFVLSEEEAVSEAARCLECGCADFFECKLINIANQYCVEPEKYSGETAVRETVNSDHPYINRNPDKCILCGLCVRICDELMGVAALGLVGRGFETVVKPAFGSDLQSGGCVSCGQCVAVCPTGALTERITAYSKQVPVEEDSVCTVCPFCSVGCKTKLTFKGGMLLRCLPDNSTDKQQILCEKGRFGFYGLIKDERVTMPRVKNAEMDLTAASAYVNERIKRVIKKYGPEAAAITVSGKLTNEDITYVLRYAGALGIGVYSFDRQKSGLTPVFGADASTCGFDELQKTDVILLIAKDITESHPVAGIHIRRAVQSGAKLECVKADEIEKAVEILNAAENAVIVFDQRSLTERQQTAFGEAFASSGKSGKPGNGIIQLKPHANNQGLADSTVGYSDDIIGKINNQTIRGLIVFSENAGDVILSNLEFLCVCGAYMTETAKKAGVLLPCAGFAESSGTYINAVGQTQKLNRAMPSACGYTNTELFQSLIKNQ